MRMTQADLDAYEARRRFNTLPKIEQHDACADESELHADIQAECRRRGWLALHGSMAHRAKRTPGEFDFIILASRQVNMIGDGLRTAPRLFLIECKAKGGKLSVEQQAIHAHARKLGHHPHVVHNMLDVLAVFDDSDVQDD